MASAAVIAVSMDGASEDRVLHPFFDKTRPSRASSANRSCSAAARDAGHHPSHEVDRSDADINTERHTLASLPQTSNTKALKRRQNQLQLVPSTGALVVQDRASVADTLVDESSSAATPVEATKQSKAKSKKPEFSGSEPFEVDPNIQRRKRRKAAAAKGPDSEPQQIIRSSSAAPVAAAGDGASIGHSVSSWQQQLEEAAFTASPEKTLDTILVRASSPCEPTLPGTADGDISPSTPSNSAGPSPDFAVFKSDGVASNSGRRVTRQSSRAASLTQTPTKSHTPTSVKQSPSCEASGSQRKMLDLGALGKLMAPKPAKEPESEVQTRPVKRERKTRKSRKSLIVVLHYGRHNLSKLRVDEASEKAHGHALETEGREDAAPAPIVEMGPPKSTHPFFLGTAAPRLDDDLSADATVRAGIGASTRADRLRGRQANQPRTVSPSNQGRKSVSPPRSAAAGPTVDKTASRPRIPLSTSTFGPKPATLPILVEPVWPTRGMTHVRGLDPSESDSRRTKTAALLSTHKKLKSRAVRVSSDEDILSRLASRTEIPSSRTLKIRQSLPDMDCPDERTHDLRLPQRLITTGSEIQAAVSRELKTRLARTDRASADSEDELHSRFRRTVSPHAALQGLFNAIGHSLSPFDKAECETQAWNQKYAPQTAAELLQPGPEPTLLKDWLRLSVVASVGTSIADHGTSSKRSRATETTKKVKKRKKRSDDELAGFVVESDDDDEADEMDEISDYENGDPAKKRSLIRSGDLVGRKRSSEVRKVTNAILLSGPHGSGKSAAAHAVAKELGFEVFEIHPGSRRSGKDVLDRVGDMTRNHLVHREKKEQDDPASEDDLTLHTEALKKDIESGRQGTMISCFTAKSQASKPPKSEAVAKPQPVQPAESTTKGRAEPSARQKQSVIILEEVDILFEEDKQFWATILALLTQSKRPVIMTCNDESLVPLEELSLHAILRFERPPREVTVDYLLLLAANEGHLLRRAAVEPLYKARDGDLRACILELDFWCRMAVGDQKGGLEWMYQRWPPERNVNEKGEKIRIASQDTYVTGMGWLSHRPSSHGVGGSEDAEDEEELLRQTWIAWNVDLPSWHDIHLDCERLSEMTDDGRWSPAERLTALQGYESAIDVLSAVDVSVGCRLAVGNHIRLDWSQPLTSDKAQPDMVQGHHQINAEPSIEYDGLSTDMALSLQTRARRSLYDHSAPDQGNPTAYSPIKAQDLVHRIANRADENQPVSSHLFTDAFLPLSFIPKPTFPSIQPQLVSLHLNRSPLPVITADFAPYIRSVIRYDSHLADQRAQLSTLLSQGKRDGKAPRTTRASRSAMEGGERKKTRRERWWDEGKRVNPVLVEQTGGLGWGELIEEQHDSGSKAAGGEYRRRRSASEAGTMPASQESVASL